MNRVHRSTWKDNRRWRTPYGVQADPQPTPLSDILLYIMMALAAALGIYIYALEQLMNG